MSPYRVLVVEDEAIVAMDIEDRLTRMGYEPAGRVFSGEGALALVEKDHPDLILMDIRLKGAMDGIDAAVEIRRRFRLPVVFLTAYSEDATLNRAKLAEPFGYILKPFDDRELKSVIEIALYKHETEEEIRRLNRLYEVLSQVNQAIVRIQTREELLPAICRVVAERGAIDLAWIGWLDPVSCQIVPAASFGKRTDMVSNADFFADDRIEGYGNPGKAIKQGVASVCGECGGVACLYPASKAPAQFGFQSCGSFPIRFQGQVCAVLTVCIQEAGFFREREMGLLSEVALDISYALDRIEDDLRHKRGEEALRESEERYRTVTESALDGIVIIDKGSLAYVNQRLCTMFGYDGPEDLVGKSPLLLVHQEDRGKVTEKARMRLEGRLASPRHEFRGITRDRRTLFVEISGTLIAQDGGVATLAYYRDITERRMIEEQLRQSQKLEEIGQLAGGVAHDFNNILTVISGYASILRIGMPETDPMAGYIDQILFSVEKAANLTQSLLAFSRKQAISLKPSDLNELTRRAKKFLTRVIGEDIDFKTTLSKSALVAMVDENQIDRVIVNIAANARDAMPKGGVLSVCTDEVAIDDAFIAAHGYGKTGQYAAISIMDSGTGMDEATLSKVFEPFFTTKEAGKGTGLGLSMAYGIVKQHGGYLSVDSELGRGTTFTIYLPIVEAHTMESRVETSQFLPGGHETVLLVEDEESVRVYVKLVLETYGYRVLEACHGEDALERFAQNKDEIDLCILDAVMPRMNGKELFLGLKKLRPDVRVLFMSGYTGEILEQKGLTEGEFSITPKPIRLPEFLRKIREVLQNNDGRA